MMLSPVTRVDFDDRVGLPPVLVEGSPNDVTTRAAVLRLVRRQLRPPGMSTSGLGVVEKLRHTLTILDGSQPVGSAQLTPLQMSRVRDACPRCGYPETVLGMLPHGERTPVLMRCSDPGCAWVTTLGARLVREQVSA